jgi:prepilin-type processing-associated H-X9-DG protein
LRCPDQWGDCPAGIKEDTRATDPEIGVHPDRITRGDRNYCPGLFNHPAGKQANFIFFDGHAKSKKWLATLYPLTQHNWQPDEPNPDPNNREIKSVTAGVACTFTVPPGPGAPIYQSRDCLPVYQ